MFTTFKSGPVPLTYTDEELLQLIDNYISESHGEFSYKNLCYYIVAKAKEEGKVEGAPHTEYSRSEMSINAGYKVSRILWEKIWNKEIYIVFGENPYQAHYNDDLRFLKYEWHL